MDQKRKIYSVSELNRQSKYTLERGLGNIWVEGEISRITFHRSGHWYFSLKDANAVISVAMFKSDTHRVSFRPANGMQVRLQGRITIYTKRGNYQLVANSMKNAGHGSLQAQFEQLKKKLAKEGLFDQNRKRALPKLPGHIGMVTSPTGAAIRDMIQVMNRRNPNLHLLLSPAKVQGPGSAQSIVEGIARLNGLTENRPSVIIVGRGGGSLEDLWSFNDEIVARAIARSKIPVVSAVGHEIDFTISDFVADKRAPTPSAAGELVVPEKKLLETDLIRYTRRMQRGLKQFTMGLRNQISQSAQSYVFHEPQKLVSRYKHRTEILAGRMRHLFKEKVRFREQINAHSDHLQRALKDAIRTRQQRLDELNLFLGHCAKKTLSDKSQNLLRRKSELKAFNPLGVLKRGYSITQQTDGTVVRDAKQLKKGAQIMTRLANGNLVSKILRSESKQTPHPDDD